MTVSRRQALLLPAGLAAASAQFRLAICSETFPGIPFAEVCSEARRAGYTGLEVDASHLGEDPASLTREQRAAVRRQIADAGLAFVGFHSFLKAPAGLHLTSPDASVRWKSWDYFARLIELCASLGPSPLMILGSGKQRSGGGAKRLEDGLARMAPLAEAQGVTILLEPLSPQFTDNVNTIAEALGIVRRIGSRALRTMLDTHNLVAETEPHARLVAKHIADIGHIHLNEMDGRYPGSGTYPFAPLLQSLRDARYAGWISVEVFDFRPDGFTVARRAHDFIRGLETQLK